jgi:hypothetical protein
MQMRVALDVLSRVVWRFNADWMTADSAAVRLLRLSLRLVRRFVPRKSPKIRHVYRRSRVSANRTIRISLIDATNRDMYSVFRSSIL